MRKITSTTILIAFCFLLLMLLFLISTSTQALIRTVEGSVTAVSDGDTFKIGTIEGTRLKIRLYGIDAPETEKINRSTGMISKQGQPYGEEAFGALKSKILGKKVRVDIIDIDRYKRMVGRAMQQLYHIPISFLP